MEKNDLIIRRQALDAMCENCATVEAVCPHYPCHRYMAVESLPSAQPEIIRCKDCKNWQTDWTPIFSNFTPEDHFCSLVDLVTEDDFFCGYAERKDDNG